jgi:nitrogen regulatory protein A
MPASKTCVMEELERIRGLTFCDLAALAWAEHAGNRMKWVSASGHLNDRYKKMIVKPGQGVSGMAIRLGRPFIMDDTPAHSDRLSTECPMMLAEQLVSALAIPLSKGKGDIRGILLLGKRKDACFSKDSLDRAERAALDLVSRLWADL